MQRPFGPHYKTTAADRNARMLARGSNFGALAGEGPAASSSRQSFMQATSQSPNGPNMLVPTLSVAAGGLAASAITAPRPVLSPRPRSGRPLLSEGHNSLMDLDNEILESYATVDALHGSVDIHQQQSRAGANHIIESPRDVESEIALRGPPPPHRVEFSSLGTQYVPVEDTTRRVTRNATMNAIYYQNAHYGVACGLPHTQEMPHAQQLNANAFPHDQHSVQSQGSSLSKTDRTVIMELLRNVRSVNGSDENELLLFLKELSPLFEISPHCSTEIIKLLLPKVGEPLFKLWLHAVSVRAEWNTLHADILNSFFPALRRREIEASELERPQRANETFSEYCENIISVAFALKTRLSESEIVEIILNKCEPGTKNHFAFSVLPQNIFELRSLAHKVSSSMKAERRYFGAGSNPAEYNVGNAGRQNQSRFRTENYPQNRRAVNFRNSDRKVIVCFKCGQEGHMARECKMHLNRK